MKANLSVKDILARLEAQHAIHQEREAFHAAEEARHREQREIHAAERETLARSLEAFRATAEAAAALAQKSGVRMPADDDDLDTGRRGLLTRLVGRVVDEKAEGERFGALALAEEVNRLFADRLSGPADVRQVSGVLRRLAAAGRIREVRHGRPRHEALFERA